MGTLIILLVLVFLVLIIGARGVLRVEQATVRVIERLGRFNRVAESGLHFIWPFIERKRSIHALRPDGMTFAAIPVIDLREQVMDFEPQPVITRDNVRMEVNSVVYYQITEPKKAIYEIANLPAAIQKLTVTTLRNVMGNLELDESLTSRDTINMELRRILDEATDKWGVRVNRVELKDISPPSDVTDAMEKQMKAERDKRARILEAEGFREAAIKEAEGKKKAAVLVAEGEAEARLKRARAEAEAIAVEFEGIHRGDPTNDLIAIRYLDALKEISKGDANKVFLPYEASSLLGSLGGIKEILSEFGRSSKEKRPKKEGPE